MSILLGCSHKWRQLDTYAQNGPPSGISQTNIERFPAIDLGIFEKVDLEKKVKLKKLGQKLDSLFIVLDATDSMNKPVGSMTRYEYGIEILNRFIETLPAVSGTLVSRIIGGDFLYGSGKDSEKSRVYGAVAINTENLTIMLGQVVRNQGSESVASVINDVARDLEIIDGHVGLMLLTNWDRMDTASRKAMAQLRHQHGDRVCIYTIGLGNHVSKTNLNARGQCGGSYTGEQIKKGVSMAGFIETLFYSGPADSDQDGIYDYLDQCPNTSGTVPIARSGCPRRSALPRPAQSRGYSL